MAGRGESFAADHAKRSPVEPRGVDPGDRERSARGPECRPDPSMSVRRIRGLNGSSGSWASDPSWNGSWMPVPKSYSLVTSSAGASAVLVSGHS